jgi:hypothetical protein
MLLNEYALEERAGEMNKSEIRLFPKNPASRRGAAIVEAALVLGILVLLVIGGMDFALQLHVRHLMTGASREAARYLAVRDGTQAQATIAAMNQLNGINATFTVTFPTPAGNHDVMVQISVPRNQVSLGLFPGSSGATITTKTTMRKEI